MFHLEPLLLKAEDASSNVNLNKILPNSLQILLLMGGVLLFGLFVFLFCCCFYFAFFCSLYHINTAGHFAFF